MFISLAATTINVFRGVPSKFQMGLVLCYWFKMLYMLYSRPFRCKTKHNRDLDSKIFPRKLRALIGLSQKFCAEGITGTLVCCLRQSLEYPLQSSLSLERRIYKEKRAQMYSYTEPVYGHDGEKGAGRFSFFLSSVAYLNTKNYTFL